MHRLTWFVAFILGFYFLTAAIQAMNAWATFVAVPGADLFCRGTIVGDVPVARLPSCTAVWFVEAKSWLFFLIDIATTLRVDNLNMPFLTRTADVAIFAFGFVALSIVATILFANMVTRLMALTLESLRGLAETVLPTLVTPRRHRAAYR